MRKMQAGEFKARCLSVMDDVNATGEPVPHYKTRSAGREDSTSELKEAKPFRFYGRAIRNRREYRISSCVARGVGGAAEMILLDTHVLIWLAVEPSNLSRKASDAMRKASQETRIAISAIACGNCMVGHP